MCYVYRFFDEEDKVIYVGLTENIVNRLTKQHFTSNGHLPKSCYDRCERIEYTKVNSPNEMRIYELYFISKHQPEYNTIFAGGGSLTFQLPELEWVNWDIKRSQRSLVIRDIDSFYGDILKASERILSIVKVMDVMEFVEDIQEKHRKRFLVCLESIKEDVETIQSCKEKHTSKSKSIL
jgi:excinuclease UvrABC nuclease subunit